MQFILSKNLACKQMHQLKPWEGAGIWREMEPHWNKFIIFFSGMKNFHLLLVMVVFRINSACFQLDECNEKHIVKSALNIALFSHEIPKIHNAVATSSLGLVFTSLTKL
jgi:hypothetical protein